jgi:hypothetical protein
MSVVLSVKWPLGLIGVPLNMTSMSKCGRKIAVERDCVAPIYQPELRAGRDSQSPAGSVAAISARPRGHADVIRRHGPPKLHDEALLELLLHLDMAFASDEKAARSAYEAALPQNSTEPDFDTLINDGWLRVIWGRISTSLEVSRAAQTSALSALLKGRFEERCHIAVLLNESEIPAHSISDHETLRDINAIRLYEDWDKGLQNILRAMKKMIWTPAERCLCST